MLLTFTTIAGVYGLTFLIVWVNILLAKAIENKSFPQNSFAAEVSGWPRWAYFVLPISVLLLVMVWGEYVNHKTVLKKVGTVAFLQPSIDQTIKWSKANETATYDKLEKLVGQALLQFTRVVQLRPMAQVPPEFPGERLVLGAIHGRRQKGDGGLSSPSVLGLLHQLRSR